MARAPCPTRRVAWRACPRVKSRPRNWSCPDRCRPPAYPRRRAARASRPVHGSPADSRFASLDIRFTRTCFLDKLVEITQAKERLSDGRLVVCQEQTTQPFQGLIHVGARLSCKPV